MSCKDEDLANDHEQMLAILDIGNTVHDQQIPESLYAAIAQLCEMRANAAAHLTVHWTSLMWVSLDLLSTRLAAFDKELSAQETDIVSALECIVSIGISGNSVATTTTESHEPPHSNDSSTMENNDVDPSRNAALLISLVKELSHCK
ncbi:hypothetical protein BSLG_001390 [Batrachochytrium salamandrivorans]|nr:hypothetical protein BSLG_001390 [Batrachochytrium salamandrivorans]